MGRSKTTFKWLFLLLGVSLFFSCSYHKTEEKQEKPYEIARIDTSLILKLHSDTTLDSVLVEKIIPHIYLVRNTYILTLSPCEAERLGIGNDNFHKIKNQITQFNNEL